MDKNIKSKYYKGKPVDPTKFSLWIAETWNDKLFEKGFSPWQVVGIVKVWDKEWSDAMDATQDIAGNMPEKIAFRKAYEMFPDRDVRVVERLKYWLSNDDEDFERILQEESGKAELYVIVYTMLMDTADEWFREKFKRKKTYIV